MNGFLAVVAYEKNEIDTRMCTWRANTMRFHSVEANGGSLLDSHSYMNTRHRELIGTFGALFCTKLIRTSLEKLVRHRKKESTIELRNMLRAGSTCPKRWQTSIFAQIEFWRFSFGKKKAVKILGMRPTAFYCLIYYSFNSDVLTRSPFLPTTNTHASRIATNQM